MPNVNTTGTQSTARCRPEDRTAPPTPTIARAIAFDRAANLRLFNNTRANAGWSTRPDPAYLELHNVEAGSKVQIINLSKNPEASFDSAKDVVDLTLTGRDIRNRQAAVYLTNEQMDAIDIKAGDQFQLRVVDPHGNVSEAVAAELEPNDWADRQVRPFESNRWTGTAAPGGQFSALDGEGQRKNLVVRAVADGRPPLLLDDKLSLDEVDVGEGQKGVQLTADRAIEPHSRVEVFNTRSGQTVAANVGADQKIRLNLPDLAEGDTLIVRPFDNENVAGAEVELLYSSKCDNGRAKPINILGARLDGVI